MKFTEQRTNSLEESIALIHSLREMRTNNLLKILEGSFDEDHENRIDLLFEDQQTGIRWILEGIITEQEGELFLKKSEPNHKS